MSLERSSLINSWFLLWFCTSIKRLNFLLHISLWMSWHEMVYGFCWSHYKKSDGSHEWIKITMSPLLLLMHCLCSSCTLNVTDFLKEWWWCPRCYSLSFLDEHSEQEDESKCLSWASGNHSSFHIIIIFILVLIWTCVSLTWGKVLMEIWSCFVYGIESLFREASW